MDVIRCSQKYCKKCGEWYPATHEYFYREYGVSGGLQMYCKPCQRSNTRGIDGLHEPGKYDEVESELFRREFQQFTPAQFRQVLDIMDMERERSG